MSFIEDKICHRREIKTRTLQCVFEMFVALARQLTHNYAKYFQTASNDLLKINSHYCFLNRVRVSETDYQGLLKLIYAK